MTDIRIMIATHKDYPLLRESYYLPVFAGAALSDEDLPYQRDDEGENISLKNRLYSELTVLYWAYKNLKSDHIGLYHYHRYLDVSKIDISEHKLVLPRKRHYFIETVYSQFAHAHTSKGLDTARAIIQEQYPEYLSSFDICMRRRSLHLYNMFVMEYDLFMKYCDFLFDVLFKAEMILGEEDRLYGYIAERLLDVFIHKNDIPYKEVRLIETEAVDWPHKIYRFLKRKYTRIRS